MAGDDESAPDPRPKPRYGEYAPEGWTWTPPEQAGASRDDQAPDAGARPAAAGAAPTSAPADGERRPASDRFLTIVLLVLGAFGAWSMAASLQDLPQQLRLAYRQQDIGEYVPGPEVPTITFIGTVLLLALYAAVLGWSILRLRAKRLSFWIPLTGGAVAVLVMFAIIFVVVLGDPTFLEYAQRISGG